MVRLDLSKIKGKKILGVDTSSFNIGAVMFEGEKFKFSSYTVSKNKDNQSRIFDLYDAFEKLIKDNMPDKVFIEESIYVNNFVTSRILSEVIGNCKSICRKYNIPFETVQNKRWKKEIVGNGNVNKDGIRDFVERKESKLSDSVQDVVDAYCIAKYGVKKESEK